MLHQQCNIDALRVWCNMKTGQSCVYPTTSTVSKRQWISQKVEDGFGQNFVETLGVCQGRID
uniref:Fibrillar collagen NC1 domain-containing protein n=1 Tax=Eptatretus burgeri TaxID=7764 RepID=A0A8C4Q4W0_EPTBU